MMPVIFVIYFLFFWLILTLIRGYIYAIFKTVKYTVNMVVDLVIHVAGIHTILVKDPTPWSDSFRGNYLPGRRSTLVVSG